VPVEAVVTSQDASSIYEVPLNLEQEGLANQALKIWLSNSAAPTSVAGSRWWTG
jgi:CTP synthase (UTP-ammonia lyase)